jgi:hypothetical protein
MLAIAALLWAAAPAPAGQPAWSPEDATPAAIAQAEKWMRERGLSEPGTRHVLRLRAQERERGRALWREVMAVETELRAALAADAIDAERVGALLRRQAELEGITARRRADTMAEQLKGLSPSDRKIFLELTGYRRPAPRPGEATPLRVPPVAPPPLQTPPPSPR